MYHKYLTTGAVVAALTGLFLLSGCGKKIEGNEKIHPTYIKAKADCDAGHYSAAASGLNDLLDRVPKSAFLHKELATLYSDNMDDCYRAIYHYQRYLTLMGNKLNSEDQRLIHGYIAACKRRAAERQIQEDPTIGTETGAAGGIDNETAEKLAKLDILEQNNKAFQARFVEYRNQIAALKMELEQAKSAAKTTPAATAAASSDTATAPQVNLGEGDSYVVQPGDTLSRITRKAYGRDTAAYRKIIMDANNLPAPNRIRVGQKLLIPKLPQ